MKKGISMVVLIITIVVLIMSSAIMILNLYDSNIIEKSQEAKVKNNYISYSKELEVNSFEEIFFKMNSEGVNLTPWVKGEDIAGTVKEYIPSISNEDALKYEVVSGQLKYIGEDENEKKWISEISNGKGVYLIEITTIDEIVEEYNKPIVAEEFSYSNPVIPVGFKAINTDDASWENVSSDFDKGLVIEDINGNQFVWVPVDGINVKYEKDFNYYITVASGYNESNTRDESPSEIDENDQINKYQGFYVARYEASIDTNDNVESKKDKDPKRLISYNNTKPLAENMYSNEFLKSGLLTGKMYDTILLWASNSGADIINSSTWGNYKNFESGDEDLDQDIMRTTGYSEFWKVNNIYDLAGNVWEWTYEISNKDGFDKIIDRGGAHNDPGTYRSVSGRYSFHLTSGVFNVGFRVALYIL